MSIEWQFLIALNEQLRRLKDPVAIQEISVRLLGEYLHASRVNYAHVEGEEYVVSRSYADGVPPFAGRSSVARFGKTIVDAFRHGETVVVDNVTTDGRFTAEERERLLAAQVGAFVGSPLFKDGRWVAIFGVHRETPQAWTRDQIALIEVTAERTWGASERAQAEEALGRSESRQAFLRRLNDIIRPLTDPASILKETCLLLGTHLHANRVVYGQVDGDDCVVVDDYVDGVPSMAGKFRWRDLVGSRTRDILEGGTLLVNDASTEGHTAEERAALKAAGIGSYMCPLLIKGGRFVAAFGIHSREPRVWTREEIALAEDVAERIWATLEHRKAEVELRANEERLAFLLRLNDALRPLGDPGEVQQAAARLLAQHLGATRVGYAEIEGGGYKISHEFIQGVAPLAGEPRNIALTEEMRAVLRRGETLVVNDVRTDPRFRDSDRETMASRQIAAFIGTALFKNGRMVAAFGANHVEPRDWTPSEIELVRDVAERTWDAVERTRVAAAMREQKQRLRLALEASAGGSWTWVAATNQVDWDEQFRALYGLAPDVPATTDAWIPSVHDDDRPRVLALLDEILTSTAKNSWENTFRIVRPDGAVTWIQSRGRVDRDADGKITRMSGLDLDFSEHRRTEELQQARRDEEHDRTLRTLLETATQGIVSTDAGGLLVFANRAIEVMFGWGSGDLIGVPLERLIPSAFRYGMNPAPAMDLVGIRQDGSTFPIEVTVNHVPTSGGGRAFAFVTDITERQRAAAALLERTDELEHRTTQLSQMAWDLTLAEHHAREQIARTLHDGLQQLLVVLALNLTQQLKRVNEGEPPISELIYEAKQQLDEAMAVARSLSVELFPPVLQRAGLPAALRWLSTWTHDKYKLRVDLTADPRADSARKDIRTLLFESVRELLFNIVKYAQTDAATVTLELDGDDQLCITVSDQGVGFEPLRLDDRSKDGEVGWGLFRLQERLTLLGGSLDINSAPGQGTRVRLVAPRGSAADASAGDIEVRLLATAAGAIDDKRASRDALRLLIVDDHPPMRRALREMLHQRPQLSVVGEAANGLEAIAQANTLRPDVVLMDVAMPHMDGVEATTRIRAELPDVRVVGLSTHGRNEAADAIEHAGADAFFVKGTDTQRLIDHLLGVHAARGAGVRSDS